MGALRALTAAAALLFSASSSALLLTATPLEDPNEANELYGPMAEILSEALGVEVNFEHSRDWLTFSKKIIASDYDLILSEPHITAYVTSNTSVLSMNALARLPGQLQYHVIVSADSNADGLKSLLNSRICMLPSPNYSGVMLMKEFTNPVTQPLVKEVHGNYSDIYAQFKKGRCNAAVIDDNSFQRLSTAGEEIKSVYRTAISPNLGLAVSQRIPPADRETIVATLKDPATSEKLSKLFAKYSLGQSPFSSATNEDYKAFNILPGIVWGW